MSNNFFQFKKFIVGQDGCAMKVCTDACVFGAFIAGIMEKEQLLIQHVLDIGTGTGLLSLLLAQKTTAVIDAIEIDYTAWCQAKKNFELSPWKERLNAFNVDALQFSPNYKYELIITNPPFYEDNLRSASLQKNAAKHKTSLTLEQLLKVIDMNLSASGISAVLLPFFRIAYFEKEAAAYGFVLSKKLLLKHTASHSWFRGVLVFTRQKNTFNAIELILKNQDGTYSHEFRELLKDYYLHL